MKLKILTAVVAALIMTGCATTSKPMATCLAYCIDYNKVYKETGVRLTEAMPNFEYEPMGSLVVIDYGGYSEKRLVADPYGPDLNGITQMTYEAYGEYYNPTTETAAIKAAEAAKELESDYIVNLKFEYGETKSPNSFSTVRFVLVTGMAVKRK